MIVLSRSKKAAVRGPAGRGRAAAGRGADGPEPVPPGRAPVTAVPSAPGAPSVPAEAAAVESGDSSAYSSAFSVVSTGTEDRGLRKTARHSAYSRACGFVFLAARVHHGSHGSFATVLTRSGSSPPSRAVDRRPPLSPPAGVVARPEPFSGLGRPARRIRRLIRAISTGGVGPPDCLDVFVTLRRALVMSRSGAATPGMRLGPAPGSTRCVRRYPAPPAMAVHLGEPD